MKIQAKDFEQCLRRCARVTTDSQGLPAFTEEDLHHIIVTDRPDGLVNTSVVRVPLEKVEPFRALIADVFHIMGTTVPITIKKTGNN